MKGLAPMLLAALMVCGPATPWQAQAMPGRFFASPRQCEGAKAIAPAACRTAFANALAEFAAKAPSYPSRRACMKAFGPCMPWPIGTRRYSSFRPQWIGIVLAADASVAPAVAPGRLRLDFATQSTASLSPAAVAPTGPAPDPEGDHPTILTPDRDDTVSRLPTPRAGGGFTVIDGVLTYPAPARFQPKTR
ncbi:DUF1190 domain-containing protein [Lichenihabitans sp. Uapishka_5]|uniref:DUF1190 domain-containing protein n=1 Tax=Lichenihabitans sp. Uapishka_5 TaxID=3037302 RepID=UPI0029E7E4AE|nr:DUF1190 domain-containing protein [Lichenihabitans sp. Uapishka_5]MDX7951709.1 DUF1190 domain-containing protein [Lichenihabitans sp. Uapishka_5]